MPEQAVTLEALYAAIEQVLRERLPEAQLIGFWPGVPENTPAVSLEIAELLPERDPGTGESALLCRLQARIMVPPGARRYPLLAESFGHCASRPGTCLWNRRASYARPSTAVARS